MEAVRKLWAMSASRQGFGRLGELRLRPARPATHRQDRARRSPSAWIDRKQRIIVRCRRRRGDRLFRLGGRRRRGARRASRRSSEQAEIKVARGARALADERHVKDLIVLNDPLGNRLEIFHGAETAAEPFRPGRSISGFRTGPLGLGHVVLNVDTAETIERDDGVLSRRPRFPADGLLFDHPFAPISFTSIRAITASPSSRPARTPCITS